jgi:hypothetical protein
MPSHDHDPPLPDDVGALVLVLGEAGALPPPAEAVGSVIAAHQTYPGVPITLAIGGFDDDPRPVCEIPEAKAFYAGLAAALDQTPWAEAVVTALDPTSQGVLALCAGWLPRDEVEFVSGPPTPRGESC